MDYRSKNKLDLFALRKDNWTYAELEESILQDFPKEGHSLVKEVILEADELGYWPKVIERYIRTNYQEHGNVSSELDRIASRIFGAEYKPSI